MCFGTKVAWDWMVFLPDAEEPNLECDQCVFAVAQVEPKLGMQIQQIQYQEEMLQILVRREIWQRKNTWETKCGILLPVFLFP